MFKKILLCIDLSPASESLMGCIGEMRRLGLEEIVLAHVIYVANTPGLEVMLEEDARPFLEQQKANLEAHGFRVTIEMPFGLPAHTLAETAENHDVDLIMIGSHGRSIIGEAVLGSVSNKLLRLTRRPVLLVPLTMLEKKNRDHVCGSIFENILFPTDFSTSAERVITYIVKIALETMCSVTLFHVLEGSESDPVKKDQRENAERFLLNEKQQRIERGGVTRIIVDQTWGDPGQKICKKVAEGDFSLIVMGSGGKGVVKELFFGSVAKEVVRHADVPMLFIPANEDA